MRTSTLSPGEKLVAAQAVWSTAVLSWATGGAIGREQGGAKGHHSFRSILDQEQKSIAGLACKHIRQATAPTDLAEMILGLGEMDMSAGFNAPWGAEVFSPSRPVLTIFTVASTNQHQLYGVGNFRCLIVPPSSHK